MVNTSQLLLFLIPGMIGFFMLLVMVPLCGNLPNIQLPLLGSAPLTLSLAIGLITFMGWGLIFTSGWTIVTSVFPTGQTMNFMVMLAIAASLYTSVALSKMVAYHFRDTSSELAEERFIGLSGAVVSTVIPRFSDGQVGQLNVTDKTGVSGVAAVIPDWAEESPKANETVQLINYDPARKLFIVIKPDGNDYLRWLRGEGNRGEGHGV